MASQRYRVSVQFRILGPVEIEAGGDTRSPPRRRERCLLGVLLLEANRVVSVDRLAELMWDDDPPKRVRGAIQGHISRLRTALGGTGAEIAFAGDGYRMIVEPDVVDAHHFRTLLERAAGSAGPAERIERLRAALDLWRGPALADAAVGRARERLCSDLEEQRLTAIEDLVSTSLGLRREREILPELARIAGDYPGREGLVALHMRALYQAGRKVDALDVYARARIYLADELGLDPGYALRELHQAILRDELPVPSVGAGSPASTSPAFKVVPRQLPADVPGFAGRTAYLEQLDGVLSRVGGGAASVVISAIGGTAGIGKTALAVHWAHRVADQFPDGQLYINLRGFDVTDTPMDSAEAVRVLLDALEVPPQRVPASLDAQVGLYRSLLAGRRTLVVLDNARNAEQVRPLLPGASGCVAVVTSRYELSSLAAAPGAELLHLDLLPAAEAHALLERRLGVGRLAAEPDAVSQIIELCAGLPLALAIVVARAMARPRTQLSMFAAELLQDPGRLDGLSGGEPAVDARIVFSWSYRALGSEAARLFLLLGLHPGPDFTAPAAASLAGVSLRQARRALAELVAANLVTEPVPGRYVLHDLLRAYAAELAHATEAVSSRRTAQHRMFDHYLHTAHAAAGMVSAFRPDNPAPVQTGCSPEHIADSAQALTWYTAEHHVLRAAVADAARVGFDSHAWRLFLATGPFHARRGWHGQLPTALTALSAAQNSGDRLGRAHAHRLLGLVYVPLNHTDQALHHLQLALDLFQDLNHHIGQAITHASIGWLFVRQERYRDALHHVQQELNLHRDSGNRVGEAGTLNNLAVICGLLGEHEQALRSSEQAIALHHELGYSHGEAHSWDTMGSTHHQRGSHREAIVCHRQALELIQEAGDRFIEAEVFTHLAEAYVALGDFAAAHEAWEQALAILDGLHHPDASEVRARLERLTLTNNRHDVG